MYETTMRKRTKRKCCRELFVLLFCSRNSSSCCFSFFFFIFILFFLLHFQLDTTNWLRFANRTKTRLHAATFLKRKFAQAATPALALALTLTLTPSLLTIQNLQVAVATKRTKRSGERASCGGIGKRERGQQVAVALSLFCRRCRRCSCLGRVRVRVLRV